ncbi:MAG: hypothetical protein QW342_06830 [Thermoproteota archaeon]
MSSLPFLKKPKQKPALTPKLSYLPYTVDILKSYTKPRLYLLKPLVKEARPFGFILSGELKYVYKIRMQTPINLSLFINTLANYEPAKVLVYIHANLSDIALGKLEKLKQKDKRPRILRKLFALCDEVQGQHCVLTEAASPASQFSMENYFTSDKEKWKLKYEVFGYAYMDPTTRDAELILLAPKAFFLYRAPLLGARPVFF